MIHHDKHSRRCERWLGLSWPRALSRIVLSLGCEILGFGLGLSTACGGSTAPVQTDLPTITDSADASGVVQGPPDATSNGDTQSTDAAVPFRGAPDASAYSVDQMEGGSDSHGVSFPLPGNDCVQIRASDYDQTCTSDPECIGVLVGNSCDIEVLCSPACPTAAINLRALPKYASDIADAMALLSAGLLGTPCGACSEPLTPCCVANTCQVGSQCPPAPPSPTDSGSAEAAVGCIREADCPNGFTCSYPVADACAAQGVCMPPVPPATRSSCTALSLACGCDGTSQTLLCSYRPGYAPGPVLHDGPCNSDAGSGLFCVAWGGSCSLLGDCCPGLHCSQFAPPNLVGACVP